MKIAIMGRSLREIQTGVARHTANLVRAMARVSVDEAVTVFVTRDRDGLDEVPNVCRVRAPLPTPNEYARALWEQTVVPLEVLRRGMNVYHSPNYILPVGLTCPSVVTVHDMTFRTVPQHHKRRSSLYLTFFTMMAARRADHIVCVSEYTRREFVRHHPYAAGKSSVIYQGLSDLFADPPSREMAANWRAGRGLDVPYVLYVGALEPRKNLQGLVRAYEMVVRSRELPHHLFLCGPVGWLADPILRAIETSPLRDRIHHVGYVPDRDLPFWYGAADAFVYPSFQEGFGLPPLEAMACGTPAVTSDTTAIPEAVGDAALTVDPTDSDALASALSSLLTDAALAEKMRMRGRERAQRFSWDDAARQLHALYEALAGGEAMRAGGSAA